MSSQETKFTQGPALVNGEVSENEAHFILSQPRNYPLLVKVVCVCYLVRLVHFVLTTYLRIVEGK